MLGVGNGYTGGKGCLPRGAATSRCHGPSGRYVAGYKYKIQNKQNKPWWSQVPHSGQARNHQHCLCGCHGSASSCSEFVFGAWWGSWKRTRTRCQAGKTPYCRSNPPSPERSALPDSAGTRERDGGSRRRCCRGIDGCGVLRTGWVSG